MEEKTDGSSRVYWDVTQPRPVSATVSRGNTDLRDLIGWWDGRGFTALKRPEVTALPDDAFKSDELKQLASDYLTAPGAFCTSGTQTYGQRELVTCSWDNGASASFYLAPDRATFEANRQYYLSDAGTVSGTFFREPFGWITNEKPDVKQGEYSQYVLAEDNSANVYFDQDSTLCWAPLRLPSGDDLQRLRDFWVNAG